MVEHQWFDTAMGGVILLNSAMIGYESSVTLEGGEKEAQQVTRVYSIIALIRYHQSQCS